MPSLQHIGIYYIVDTLPQLFQLDAPKSYIWTRSYSLPRRVLKFFRSLFAVLHREFFFADLIWRQASPSSNCHPSPPHHFGHSGDLQIALILTLFVVRILLLFTAKQNLLLHHMPYISQNLDLSYFHDLCHIEALFISPIFSFSQSLGMRGDLVFTQYPYIFSNTIPKKYTNMMKGF
jgi:hypothetical protein